MRSRLLACTATIAMLVSPLSTTAAAPAVATSAAQSANPLLGEWTTPDGVPPYDRIRPKRGNTRDPAESYTAFRGRMPTTDALLRNRGLE